MAARRNTDQAGGKMRSLLPSLDVLPWFLALAFGRAWLTLTYSAPNVALPGLSTSHYQAFDYAYCLVSVLVVLAARRIAPLCEARWAKPLTLGCMLAASACCLPSLALGPTAVPGHLVTIGSVIAGAGFGLFLLLWSEVLSVLSMRRIVMQLAAAQVLAVVILFFCQDFGPLRLGVSIVALPLIAMLCIVRSYEATPAPERPRRSGAGYTFPWKIVALLGVYSFAYGIRQQTLTAAGNVYTTWTIVAVMAVLFVGARFFADRLSLSLLYRSPIPLMACGFLLMPVEGLFGGAFSNLLVSASYVLASTLFSLLIYDIAKRVGIAVVALFGIKNAMQVFVAWGSGAAELLERSALPAGTQSLVLGIAAVSAIIVATFILFSEKELTTKWGVSLLDTGALGERSRREEALSLRCDELSRSCHLSPREDEILRLLAAGKTTRAIAVELGIAEGTTKAHTSHIYEKVGVAGRSELDAVLGASAA